MATAHAPSASASADNRPAALGTSRSVIDAGIGLARARLAITASLRTRQRVRSRLSGTAASRKPDASSREASTVDCSTADRDLRIVWWVWKISSSSVSPAMARTNRLKISASWVIASPVRCRTVLRARAGKISRVAPTPTRLPSRISSTRQPAASKGSMRVLVPPISTMAAVIGATLRLGRTAAPNDRTAITPDRISPSSITVRPLT